MKPITYNEFVDFLFERSENDTEWYFQEDFYKLEINNRDIINHITKLYDEIERLSENYSEVQLCLGLNYLINSSCSMLCYSFFDEEIPEQNKVNGILLMFNVFSKVFDKKCLEYLSHENESSFSKFNKLCYMWWDIFPRHGIPRKPELNAIDNSILHVLEKILCLNNIACKESALHGLGHWHVGYPEKVEIIIRTNKHEIPECLGKFSEMAIVGDIQ